MNTVLGGDQRQRPRRKKLSKFKVGTALLLTLGLAFTITPAVPAIAANGASVAIDKDVDGVKSNRDVRPGDIIAYTLDFAANDDDADGPVRIVDQLPSAFAGWQIMGAFARFAGSPTGLTLSIPGVHDGPAPAEPVSGTLSLEPDELTITVEVALPVFPGTGNDGGMGMPVGSNGVITYSLVVPDDIGTDDPILGTELLNTATISAFAGLRPISDESSAVIEVVNPVLPLLEPTKTWLPAAQELNAGEPSTIQIGAKQASATGVTSIELRDPADPALTPDGATTLPAGNPFNFVNFTGFTSPTDPLSSLPANVERVNAEVYYFASGSWSWVPWESSLDTDNIAGVNLRYESDEPDILPATVVSQEFEVQQRATQRSDGAPLTSSWAVDNTVRATVAIGEESVNSFDATARFSTITPQIEVRAQKNFLTPGTNVETTDLVASAGDLVPVVLRVGNREEPFSSTLDSLTITEPAAASSGNPTSAEYFGPNLEFAGFDNSAPQEIWPVGATGGEIRWITADGPIAQVLTVGAALPAAPTGEDITGFVIEFTGAIEPSASSVLRYAIQTNASEDFIAPGETKGPYLNRIEVTGEAAGLNQNSVQATSQMRVSAPAITVGVQKRIGPQSVLPDQTVFVQLDTSAVASGVAIDMDSIVVEDSLAGASAGGITEASSFWNAFDLKQILPPIARPVLPNNPGSQADLSIFLADANGDWDTVAWTTNPASNVALTVPLGTTGVRFVYSAPTGERFSQTTFVKPNLAFVARDTLRISGDPTAQDFPDRTTYTNLATAIGSGTVNDRPLSGTGTARSNGSIAGDTGDDTPKPGSGTWSAKNWNSEVLTAQSQASVTSTQSWAVVDPGYTSATLQDPVVPSGNGVGTVFETFDLTHIRPVGVTSTPASGTRDARFKWDSVDQVQLFMNSAWVTVPAPTGGWMNPTTAGDGGGFKGYTLTDAERQDATGMRLIIVSNVPAREAAAAEGDITAPAPDAGVSASADVRPLRLDWQLRNAARSGGTPTNWVTGSNIYNCESGDAGCVENTFVSSVTNGSTTKSDESEDEIDILNGTTNVGLDKRIQALSPSGAPVGAHVEELELPVPNSTDGIRPEDYPKARITLIGTNTSESPQGATGAMQLARIRVTDSVDPDADPPAVGESMFELRNFTVEANAGENPFNSLTVQGISFGQVPESIDIDTSRVELWVYDENTPAGVTEVFTMRQIIELDSAYVALLPNIVGASTSFSVNDPEANGNGIPAGASVRMEIDVQLRQTERVGGAIITGGTVAEPKLIHNLASARGWDAAVYPDRYINDFDGADLALHIAEIKVSASKSLSVSHGNVRNQTLYEPEPDNLVRVALNASSNGATAPIQQLRIEDDSEDFWNTFQLVSVEAAAHPVDANTAEISVKVAGNWQLLGGYTGDLTEIRGIRVNFTRDGGSELFPTGASAWFTSWNAASLPFTVMLRPEANVDWMDGSETNTVTASASAPSYDTVSADASATITFSPGTHRAQVVKRAPSDTTTHQVDPLVAYPWDLTITNTGNSFLPVVTITDELPANIHWTGGSPAYISVPGTRGETGLTDDPAEIAMTLSEDHRNIEFRWPEGQRMYPGESMTIHLPLEMGPAPFGTHEFNTVRLDTGVVLATCTRPTDFGQQPVESLSPTECANSNYVTPRAGTHVATVKSVHGEIIDTLGEDLVSGAVNVGTKAECQPLTAPLVPENYYRFPCASNSVVGGTDSWSLQTANVGSTDLSRVVVVDMLPMIGDRLLGGAARDSTYKPVLQGDTVADSFEFEGVPGNATYTIDVTTNPDACVGATAGSTLWSNDPTCEDTVTNPANQWVSAALFTGALAEITGVRFTFDLTETPLVPSGTIGITYQTVNQVGDGSDQLLAPTLAQFADDQTAWNQDGVFAWNTDGTPVVLPMSPLRAGVQLATTDLEVGKEILGSGAEFAADSFEVALECTVPSGVETPERVVLDLGEYALMSVPADGSVTVPNLPVGANCEATEVGELGTYGEQGRSIAVSPGVSPAADGLSAEVLIRQQEEGLTHLQFTNTYTTEGLTVEKAVLSTNEHPVTVEQATGSFAFELSCTIPGRDETLVRSFTVSGGAQHVEQDLPEGAVCELRETQSGGANYTTITVGNIVNSGTEFDEITISAGGTYALVSNEFSGTGPTGLVKTGGTGAPGVIGIAAMLVVLGASVWLIRAKRRGTT